MNRIALLLGLLALLPGGILRADDSIQGRRNALLERYERSTSAAERERILAELERLRPERGRPVPPSGAEMEEGPAAPVPTSGAPAAEPVAAGGPLLDGGSIEFDARSADDDPDVGVAVITEIALAALEGILASGVDSLGYEVVDAEQARLEAAYDEAADGSAEMFRAAGEKRLAEMLLGEMRPVRDPETGRIEEVVDRSQLLDLHRLLSLQLAHERSNLPPVDVAGGAGDRPVEGTDAAARDKALQALGNLDDVAQLLGEKRFRDALGDPDAMKALVERNAALARFLSSYPSVARALGQADQALRALRVANALVGMHEAIEKGNWADFARHLVTAAAQGGSMVADARGLELAARRLGTGGKAINDLVSMIDAAGRGETTAALAHLGDFLKNGYDALPPKVRDEMLSSLGPYLDKADRLGAMIKAAGNVHRLVSEWDDYDRRLENIARLAAESGPDAVGYLVEAATRSPAAGEFAKLVVELGVGHLTAEVQSTLDAIDAWADQEARGNRADVEMWRRDMVYAASFGLDFDSARLLTGALIDRHSSDPVRGVFADILPPRSRPGDADWRVVSWRLEAATTAYREHVAAVRAETGGVPVDRAWLARRLADEEMNPARLRSWLDQANAASDALDRLEAAEHDGVGRDVLVALRQENAAVIQQVRELLAR